MLPDFRFAIGAALATAFLGVTTVGLFATVRFAHQPKIGPLEASRLLAFERADWNQFADPESVRRFDELARRIDAADAVAAHSADAASAAPMSSAVPAPLEPHAYDHQAELAPVPATAATEEAKPLEPAPPLDLAPPPAARASLPDQPNEPAAPAPAVAAASSAAAADEPSERSPTAIAAPV